MYELTIITLAVCGVEDDVEPTEELLVFPETSHFSANWTNKLSKFKITIELLLNFPGPWQKCRMMCFNHILVFMSYFNVFSVSRVQDSNLVL